jgi:cytochrome c
MILFFNKNVKKSWPKYLLFIFLIQSTQLILAQNNKSKILVFSKTKGWKHSSIPFGIAAIQKLGLENNFDVDTTKISENFTDSYLSNYSAVVFNCTTGDVLNNEQQAAFERYIQAGGAFVGIHSAADTEYGWPWYGELAGAYFESHPSNSNVQKATVEVVDSTFMASSHLPKKWNRTDEWYNYKSIFRDIKVLAYLDESTYNGGTNGGNHPIAWYHEYDGGRAFYTGFGHTDESFSEPDFLKHLLGGIKYAIGNNLKLDYSKSYSKTKPEESRFEKTILVNDLDNPMELAVSNDGRVFFTELEGNLSLFDVKTNKHKIIHRFPLVMKGGTGLIGITLDPNFDKNNWIYLYYSPPIEGEPIYFNLSRFTISKANVLDLTSEKVLLKVPVQINSGAHHGGSLGFDKDNNLILSTGDGTTPFPSNGYAPIDERADPIHYPMDAQRSAANTNDLKGKILKIHPETDGSYTIPKGNLFEKGTEKTKPEIYAMGCRNPYRIAVNPKTGTIYWGEIGPDAGEDSTRGPKGYDEFNQAKVAGNYGWPYFVGNNIAYAEWDFATKTAGPNYDPKMPINNSPNNNGLLNLPPAKAAMIYYPYALSPEFPELGLGGRSAMAGEFYTFNQNSKTKASFPEYYDGALFVFDWMRNWVMALRFDENENYVRNEKFMPTSGDFRRPIDLAFSKDGIMYMLEYGSVYGADNVDARLVKIVYNNGNRPPVASAFVMDTVLIDKFNKQSFITSESRAYPKYKEIVGSNPLKVKVSGKGIDPDFNDQVSYEWSVNKKVISRKPIADYVFKTVGIYYLILKVTDQSGLTSTDTIKVTAGNSKPTVTINTNQNRTFYFDNKPLQYNVVASDIEDKKVVNSKILTAYNYNPQPLVPETDVAGGSKIISTIESGSLGKTLIESNDCKACHQRNKKSVGPSYEMISKKYSGRTGALDMLTKKIIEGGGGNWGTEHVMAAHPQLGKQDVQEIVKYIFALTDPKQIFKPAPQMGKLEFNDHISDSPKGFYTLKASYTDNGVKGLFKQKGESFYQLRYNTLRAMDADKHPGFNFEWGELREGASKSYLLFRNIDLKGITKISFEYASLDKSGEIEIRKNSVAGPIIGSVKFDKTGGWNKMEWVDCNLNLNDENFQDLYFVAVKKDRPSDKLIKFKSIKFD